MCFREEIGSMWIYINGRVAKMRDAVLLASDCACRRDRTWWVTDDVFTLTSYQGPSDIHELRFLYRTRRGFYVLVEVYPCYELPEDGSRVDNGTVFKARFLDAEEARREYERLPLKFELYDDAFPGALEVL